MKATVKSVAAALAVLALTVAVLLIVDGGTANVSATKSYLKVTVVDLDNNPLHNAEVSVNERIFKTDNKGLSPAIELDGLTNCYDDTIEQWKTVTVVVKKDGYAPAVTFNCVVYVGQTRKLTIRLFSQDSSDLPYTVYVESPPNDYVEKVVK